MVIHKEIKMKLKMYGKSYNVIPLFGKYCAGGSLALQLIEVGGNPFGNVTVNLVDETLSDEMCAFIDTNNFGEDIVEWLRINKFGDTTGKVGFSGFCTYPEFRFNRSIVEENGCEEDSTDC